ncbi:Protein lethal(2)essential for life [Aphelenchoides besseyi]|nr:Protein lethal(2)essential for life [Aphelenchoides besseyi]KAI6229393.1 Protein lethal(2)essential for life [Aphelenchoides besseyi]
MSSIRRQTQQEMTYRYRSPFSSSYFPSSRWLDDFDFDRPIISRPYYQERPFREAHRFADGINEPVSGPDYFSLQLDVSAFKPEELKVTVIENQVVIEGRHDERQDRYGEIERYFVRKYTIPDAIKPEDVTSELSKDGILTVQTLQKAPVEDEKVRNIPIQPKN